jgi:uncharacterized membrane protein
MPASPERILFEAVSTPSRSFRPGGFVVMAALAGLWAIGGGTVFLLLGAWPVLPFMGLETFAVLGLVAAHHRWSGRAREVVLLTESRLSVRRIDASGRRMEAALDPYWARVVLTEREGLALVQRGRRVPVGCFLSDDEKQDLAAALQRVLAAYRQPVFDNPQLR